MRFTVIEGGRSTDTPDKQFRQSLSARDVEIEARRRLKEAGFERSHVRYQVTGEPVPRALQYLRLQINWVAETLASIDPIPADFTDDKYWPKT